jgi:hypothetical protein
MSACRPFCKSSATGLGAKEPLLVAENGTEALSLSRKSCCIKASESYKPSVMCAQFRSENLVSSKRVR